MSEESFFCILLQLALKAFLAVYISAFCQPGNSEYIVFVKIISLSFRVDSFWSTKKIRAVLMKKEAKNKTVTYKSRTEKDKSEINVEDILGKITK